MIPLNDTRPQYETLKPQLLPVVESVMERSWFILGENVAAFVVAKSAVAAEELLAHCRARLSSYKVPRHLWLRREDELPEKPSGKVDKAALRAEAARLLTAGGDRPESPPARRP